MRFSQFTLRHASNGAVVQDGLDTYAIRANGTEVWAATTGENLSRLQVDVPDLAVIEAARGLVYTGNALPDDVGTGMTAHLQFDEAGRRNLREHIAFVASSEFTAEQEIAYLWDVIKMELSNKET